MTIASILVSFSISANASPTLVIRASHNAFNALGRFSSMTPTLPIENRLYYYIVNICTVLMIWSKL